MQPKLELPQNLIDYLKRRASRNGATLEETLADVVREALHFDQLVVSLSQPRKSHSAVRN